MIQAEAEAGPLPFPGPTCSAQMQEPEPASRWGHVAGAYCSGAARTADFHGAPTAAAADAAGAMAPDAVYAACDSVAAMNAAAATGAEEVGAVGAVRCAVMGVASAMGDVTAGVVAEAAAVVGDAAVTTAGAERTEAATGGAGAAAADMWAVMVGKAGAEEGVKSKAGIALAAAVNSSSMEVEPELAAGKAPASDIVAEVGAELAGPDTAVHRNILAESDEGGAAAAWATPWLAMAPEGAVKASFADAGEKAAVEAACAHEAGGATAADVPYAEAHDGGGDRRWKTTTSKKPY